jgi:hypothetical protein
VTDYSFERMVMVWGEPQTVTVYQRSRTVWVAIGDYMGNAIDVKGSSERRVLKLWMDAARDSQP